MITQNTMNSVDPLNYMMMDSLLRLETSIFEERNNLQINEGYYLDVIKVTSKNIRLVFRTDFLQTLCVIAFKKDGFIIKYAQDFCIQYQKRKFTSTLDDNVYEANEISTMFNDVDFDVDYMVELLMVITELYYNL